MFTPASLLGMWFRALLSLVLIGVGVYLLALWYTDRDSYVAEPVAVSATAPETTGTNADPDRRESEKKERFVRVPWQFGINWPTAFLVTGLALLAWSFGGGWLVSPRLWRRVGADEPHEMKGEISRLRLPDGSSLHLECHGPKDAPAIVCVHGWGLDNQEWYYFKKAFGNDRRLITWDLPGLGNSDRPADRDWSLEKLAAALDAVIASAGHDRVTLVGHSIGVMIILTYCKLYPAALGTRVDRLVLAQSTYTNPLKTMPLAGLYCALQTPVLTPLCWLMIATSPLFRVMNWLSYANGSAHRSTEKDSFSGNETRGQLDFMTNYCVKASPAVVAHGVLAMFEYDATETLSRIGIPTLIVAGDNDRICLPEASVTMARAIPKAQLVVLEASKHCGLFEHPDEFHAAVRTFLHRPDSDGTAATATEQKTALLGAE